jgi:hypothetical protein
MDPGSATPPSRDLEDAVRGADAGAGTLAGRETFDLAAANDHRFGRRDFGVERENAPEDDEIGPVVDALGVAYGSEKEDEQRADVGHEERRGSC